MSIRSYQDLEVWQQAIRLVTATYAVTQHFPKHETYGLTSQIQRAAISVPANIAEGHERDYTKEFLRHLSISAGSLAELETLLIVARELKYLDTQQCQSLLEEGGILGRRLRALQRSLKKRVQNDDP